MATGALRRAAQGNQSMSEPARQKPSAYLATALVLAAATSPFAAPAQTNPATSETSISVEFAIAGAKVEAIDALITPKLENYLGAAEGLQFMVSMVRAGSGHVTLKFKPAVNPDVALANVRSQLARALAELPPEIGRPEVTKIEASAQPVAYLAFHSDRRPPAELTRIVDPLARQMLQTVSGIEDVRLVGARPEVIRIRLDRNRLAAHGLTPGDVEAALRRANIVVRAGRRDGEEHEFLVDPKAAMAPEALNRIVIKAAADKILRLGDIARVELAAQFDGTHVRFDRQPAMLVVVTRRAGADPIEVTRGVRARLPDILVHLPQSVDHKIGYSCERCAGPRPR